MFRLHELNAELASGEGLQAVHTGMVNLGAFREVRCSSGDCVAQAGITGRRFGLSRAA